MRTATTTGAAEVVVEALLASRVLPASRAPLANLASRVLPVNEESLENRESQERVENGALQANRGNPASQDSLDETATRVLTEVQVPLVRLA